MSIVLKWLVFNIFSINSIVLFLASCFDGFYSDLLLESQPPTQKGPPGYGKPQMSHRFKGNHVIFAKDFYRKVFFITESQFSQNT